MSLIFFLSSYLLLLPTALHHIADIVMPIPETSRTSALQVAATLQRPYREGFVKNRYIARTFIMPVCYLCYLYLFNGCEYVR